MPVTTSATSHRPGRWDAPLRTYTFRRIKTELFHDYRLVEVSTGQHAFVASPEKALLDLAGALAGDLSEDHPGAASGARGRSRVVQTLTALKAPGRNRLVPAWHRLRRPAPPEE